MQRKVSIKPALLLSPPPSSSTRSDSTLLNSNVSWFPSSHRALLVHLKEFDSLSFEDLSRIWYPMACYFVSRYGVHSYGSSLGHHYIRISIQWFITCIPWNHHFSSMVRTEKQYILWMTKNCCSWMSDNWTLIDAPWSHRHTRFHVLFVASPFPQGILQCIRFVGINHLSL